ncbi:MAG: adenylate/guanylate cyclase domain-containing protein [Treponema sp.]|jgi:class 3 adenylate cyclase/HAMP domain-containing protein|nr:adenylate/guanylate cyclase domain-containing protein [Treponema sp.]
MKIRLKIILVVLPLIIATLCLAEAASYFTAANGISRITRQFLNFKVNELQKYAGNQWSLLVENGYSGRADMVEAAKNAVNLYARSIILSGTEVIFAVDETGNFIMGSSPIEIRSEEKTPLITLLKEENEGIITAKIGGVDRVLESFYFTPFSFYYLVSEEKTAFYRDIDRITMQTIIMIAAASAAAIVLLIIFSRHLTNPLSRVVNAMNGIIDRADLSSRVEVEYRDETGKLAETFNLMIGELDKAYTQIKRYAFDAVLAGKKEQRIRNIFQKYVPKDVIEEFFVSPDPNMLKGKDAYLSILFSDIRGFTTISEAIKDPADLVESLNRYFSDQVDIIMNRNGIVDKYIGDAIMAFWGAPARHEDDALQSVLSGLDMIDALSHFNEYQVKTGKPKFNIGIGINYGEVTVGNIGSERKMDYTVIGDAVNLASRMEGLTKTYHSEILITETLYAELLRQSQANPGGEAAKLRFRLLDTVAVKGKKLGVKIYTVKKTLSTAEEKAWPIHNEGMALYYKRSFREAAAKFREARLLLSSGLPAGSDVSAAGDFNAENLYKRCIDYAANPPPADWDGVEVMKTK